MDEREIEVAEILASMTITRELYTWAVYTAIARGLELEFWGASNLHAELRRPIDGCTRPCVADNTGSTRLKNLYAPSWSF